MVRGDRHAHGKIRGVDTLTHLLDPAGELVTEDERRRPQAVLAEEAAELGTADSGVGDPEDDVTAPGDRTKLSRGHFSHLRGVDVQAGPVPLTGET